MAAAEHAGEAGLTTAELEVLRKLTDAHNAYCALPDERPGELREWVQLVHRLQDMIMSRAAVRCHPGRFTGLFLRRSL